MSLTFTRTGPYVPINPSYSTVVGNRIVVFAAADSTAAYRGMFAVKDCTTGDVRQFQMSGFSFTPTMAGYPTVGPDGKVYCCISATSGTSGGAALVAVTPSTGAYVIIPIPITVGWAHCVSDGTHIWIMQVGNGGNYAVKYEVATATFTNVSATTSVVMPSTRPMLSGGNIVGFSRSGLTAFYRINTTTNVRTQVPAPTSPTPSYYNYGSGRIYDGRYWISASGEFLWMDVATFTVGRVSAAAFGSLSFDFDTVGNAYGFAANSIRIANVHTGNSGTYPAGSPSLDSGGFGDLVEFCNGKIHIGSHTPQI